MLDIEHGCKHMDAAKLAKLLEQLPEGSRIMVNSVGNLLMFDNYFLPVGYVDFNSEEVVKFED